MADFDITIQQSPALALEVVEEPTREVRVTLTSGEPGPTGEQGPTGPQGPQGEPGTGGGGVTDHGALTGLSDDDHPQYHNDARGDARYAPLSHVGTGGTAHSNAVASGAAGFLAGTDKAKLDGIESAATADQSASEILSALLGVDGSGSGLDADTLDGHDTSYFQAASGYTASDVLSKLLTVDGTGSGLDADTVDGSHASAFAATSHTHAAADVTSGVLGIGRLATGTPDGTKFVRDDGVLATPPGGSNYRTLVTLGSDVVNNNATANTYQDVTGLSIPISANTTYRFIALIIYDAAATTTGSRWSVNGPTNTFLAYSSRWSSTSSGSQSPIVHWNTYDSAMSVTTATSFTTSNLAVLEGIVRCSATGTFVIRFASEISGSAITAKAGSTLEYW